MKPNLLYLPDAKFAPPPWHSFGTVVDVSYEALDVVARGAPLPVPRPRARSRVHPPVVTDAPPADFGFAAPDPALDSAESVHGAADPHLPAALRALPAP